MEPSWAGSGRFQTVLTAEEEQLIVIALQTLSQLCWPCGPEEVKLMIKSYLDSQNKKTVFKGNTPGEDWMLKFKKKYFDQIHMKKVEVLTPARAKIYLMMSQQIFLNLFTIHFRKITCSAQMMLPIEHSTVMKLVAAQTLTRKNGSSQSLRKTPIC